MSPTPTVTPITPSIGAEVGDVSLADIPGDTALSETIRAALLKHQVLVFRQQQIDREQHKAFGRLFGELHVHPSKRSPTAKGDPEIFTVKADETTTRNNGGRWHMDVSCDEIPPRGSILLLTDAPADGGDTVFANMNLAFETLSAPVKAFLSELTAYHDGLQDLRWYGYQPEPGSTYPATSHPVVVAHPDTGQPILNVNEAFTSHIEGLAAAESDAILAMLFAHISSNPLLHCRVRWEPGTVVFWDNRAVQHFAVWDYFPNLRRGERVSICGVEAPQPAFSARGR
ncbi:MAG: TauD/TfdA dioxygenase family protein [Acidimicrobiales bacterium]